MADKESFHQRLWNLLGLRRSASVRHLAEDLLDLLVADFSSEMKYFAESEYRDPAFQDALLEILLRRGTVPYFPKELTALVKKMIGGGGVLSLYSGLGEFLHEFGGVVGVEPNPLMARWSKFLLAIGRVDSDIIQANPKEWKSEQVFDRIICNTPSGVKNDQTQLLGLTLVRLSDAGQLVLLVPPAFLFVEKYSWYREWVLSHGQVKAVISLPPKLFSQTCIQTAIVLIERGTTGGTYMAASRSSADLSAIGEDYKAWREGEKPTVGFEDALDVGNWSVSRYEPIDFGFDAVSFPHRVVPLRDLAVIRSGVLTPESKLAVNRTGSKVLWLDDQTDVIEKSNIFLEPNSSTNATYLYLYLSSSKGKQGLNRVVKGATIPNLSAKDLQLLPVLLPDASMQAKIVNQAIEIKKTTSTLEALVEEAKQSLSNNIFELEPFRTKILASCRGSVPCPWTPLTKRRSKSL